MRTSPDAFDRGLVAWLALDQLRTLDDRRRLLIQNALSTSDPRIYASAYRACFWPSVKAGDLCSLLSARHWASLDNGNAVPWLYLLKQAQVANDLSGQQEAITRMANADRFEMNAYAEIGAVIDRIPADDPDVAAIFDMVTRPVGIHAAEYVPVDALLRTCRDRAGGDANVAQQCQQIGRRIFDRSDTFQMRSYGARIVEMATGDGSLRKISAHELDVMMKGESAEKYAQCAGMRDLVRQLRLEATRGYMPVMHERVRAYDQAAAMPATP